MGCDERRPIPSRQDHSPRPAEQLRRTAWVRGRAWPGGWAQARSRPRQRKTYVTGLTTGKDTSPLRATGLAASITVAQAAFGRLAELLSGAGMPGLAYLLNDDEHRPYALDAHLWTPKLIDGTEPKGGTELLYDGRSFLDLYNSRLRGDGSAITGGVPTDDFWWQEDSHRGFYYWVSHLVWETADAAKVAVQMDTARALWPLVLYSNYEDVSTVRGSVVPWDYYWNIREYNRRARGRSTAIVLYPVAESNFIDLTWASVVQWCTALGVEPVGNGADPADVIITLRAITVAWAKAKIDEAFAANLFFGVADPATAWLPTTDYAATHTLAGGTWHLTAADVREIALHYAAAGGRIHIWWWNDGVPGGLTAEAADALAALIAEINTATEVITPAPVTPPPSRTARRMLRLGAAHVRRFGTENLTITESINGTLDPATGKRNVTSRSITIAAVRRPVVAERTASGNDSRTVDGADFSRRRPRRSLW